MNPELEAALRQGPQSASELGNRLGISQPTLSRALARARAEVALLGRARNRRYGLYRHIRELPSEVPVHRVSATGETAHIGTVLTIAPDRFWYHDLEHPPSSAEHYSLPWLMTDMRPQGYLGR